MDKLLLFILSWKLRRLGLLFTSSPLMQLEDFSMILTQMLEKKRLSVHKELQQEGAQNEGSLHRKTETHHHTSKNER